MAGPAPRRSIVAQPLDAALYMPYPSGGWDADTAPQYMSEQYAYLLDNFDPWPGRLRMRRGITARRDWSTLGANVFLGIRGHVVLPSHGSPPQIILTRCTTNGLSNDESLWVRPNTDANLAASDGFYYYTTPSTAWWGDPHQAASASPPYNLLYSPGKSYTSLYDVTYFVANANVTGLPAAFPHGSGPSFWTQQTRLEAIDFAGNSYFYGALSNVPENMTAIKAYQQRLWILGGDSGVMPGSPDLIWSPNSLFFSNPIAVNTVIDHTTATAWVDPLSGQQNQLFIDANIEDPGMGLAVVNQRLVIFRWRSVYLLLGTTPANYSVQPLSKEVGCIDQQSLVETDHGVYFMSHRGFMLTNGTSVTNVSGKVERSLTDALAFYQYNARSGRGGDVTAQQLYDGSIIVAIRAGSLSDATLYDTIWSGVYHPDTNTWSRYTSTVFGAQDSYSGDGVADYTKIGMPGYLLGDHTSNEVLSIGNHTSASIDSASENQFTSVNTTSTLQGFDALLLTGGSVSYYQIPAKWITPFLPLSEAGRFQTSVVRWWVDYLLQGADTSSSSNYQFVATLYDETWNSRDSLNLPLVTRSSSVPSEPSYVTARSLFPPNPVIQRLTSTNQMELTRAQFQLAFQATYDSASPLPSIAEIYGVGVEHQQGPNLNSSS